MQLGHIQRDRVIEVHQTLVGEPHHCGGSDLLAGGSVGETGVGVDLPTEIPVLEAVTGLVRQLPVDDHGRGETHHVVGAHGGLNTKIHLV